MKRLAGCCVAFALLQLCGVAVMAQVPLGYYRQPAVSNDSVVFVAEGDLWRVGIDGGIAVRLTTNLAAESNPAISPDGKLIAFTARYEGPAEVYVMPISGGAPVRLTFEGDNAQVQGFTPGGSVLYATPRYSDKPDVRLYTIDPRSRVSSVFPLHQAAEGCFLDRRLIFTRQQ